MLINRHSPLVRACEDSLLQWGIVDREEVYLPMRNVNDSVVAERHSMDAVRVPGLVSLVRDAICITTQKSSMRRPAFMVAAVAQQSTSPRDRIHRSCPVRGAAACDSAPPSAGPTNTRGLDL